MGDPFGSPCAEIFFVRVCLVYRLITLGHGVQAHVFDDRQESNDIVGVIILSQPW